MKRVSKKAARLLRRIKGGRDDRGSAIVIVIIAMAMIGILASTLLWMSYMNYMIKAGDIRNKNSFYSAEEVVEQIMSGLRQDAAEAVGTAYREVLANWDNLETESNRSHVFTTAYLDALVNKFKNGSDLTHYDRSKLALYVDGYVDETTGFTSPDVDFGAWKWGNAVTDSKGDSFMEVVNNNSVILKNIYVSCTGSDGRLSVVKTDICLDVPKLVFENGGSIDALYQYTLIGNAGVDVKVEGAVKTEGSIYAGTDVDGKGGFQVGEETAATSLTMEGALRLISKGDISVAPSSKLLVRDVPGQDNRVYAKNITVKSATASLDSKVYVANDLTLDGDGSRVALSKEYYGYGNSTNNGLPNADGSPGAKGDPEDSSAIIINGRNSTVDMSSVTRLLIAGRSYISPHMGNAAGDTGREEDPLKVTDPSPSDPVMMGESIAVKGGQVAYLVPAECIGTLDHESVIGQNPINAGKVDDIEDFKIAYNADSEEHFKEVDFDRPVYRLGGKRLRDLGVGSQKEHPTADDDMPYFRKVYVQYQGHSLLYYYLVMDRETAERYFVQYYDVHANREEIDAYFNRYLSGGFQLGDFADPKNEYTVSGNSLVSSALTDSGVTLLTGVNQLATGEGADPAPVDPDAYPESGENAEEVKNHPMDVAALSAQFEKEYKSLTFNLTDSASVPDFADPAEAAEYVFKSVIKENAVKEYLDNTHGDLPALSHSVSYKNASGQLVAYLTREPDVSVSGLGSDIRLIVSTGNVKVDKDFTGLIVAKGKITVVTGVANIKLGGTGLYDALEAKSEHYVDAAHGDQHKMIDWFVNGGSMANGAQASDVDDVGNLVIDYGELVRYRNWIKK